MNSWQIELKDFSGKEVTHPFIHHLLEKNFSDINDAKKQALQVIKQYPPFVRANLVNENGESISLIDERWFFKPLILDSQLSEYLVSHIDIEYFLRHLKERKREHKLPEVALNDPLKFWTEYLLGAEAYVDYRRNDDPSPSKTYKLYVLKDIPHDKRRKWEAVFDLNYRLHQTNRLYTDVFDHHFDLKFKTFYDVQKSKTLKNIKNKNIKMLNLRFQWHVHFLSEQIEEARLAAYEDEICNAAWQGATVEDKEIANVLVPISDFSRHIKNKVAEEFLWLANAASNLIGYFHCMNNDKTIFNAGGRWLTKKEKSLWISLTENEKSFLRRLSQLSETELLSESDLFLLCNIYSRKAEEL